MLLNRLTDYVYSYIFEDNSNATDDVAIYKVTLKASYRGLNDESVCDGDDLNSIVIPLDGLDDISNNFYPKSRTVRINFKTNEVSCSCFFTTTMLMPCRHIYCVLNNSNQIPVSSYGNLIGDFWKVSNCEILPTITSMSIFHCPIADSIPNRDVDFSVSIEDQACVLTQLHEVIQPIILSNVLVFNQYVRMLNIIQTTSGQCLLDDNQALGRTNKVTAPRGKKDPQRKGASKRQCLNVDFLENGNITFANK